eukprot:GILK01005892.1.p1 GENE.GILK01005892.1~~GILK01005892.1.p1  ORF type:complete len:154 (-),score=30.85 GILK01005892.1:177-590(-)
MANDSEKFDFLYDLKRVPCVRETILWSYGIAAVGGAQKYIRTKDVRASVVGSLPWFMIGGLASWFLCRQNFVRQRQQHQMLYDIQYQKMLQKHEQLSEYYTKKIESGELPPPEEFEKQKLLRARELEAQQKLSKPSS